MTTKQNHKHERRCQAGSNHRRSFYYVNVCMMISILLPVLLLLLSTHAASALSYSSDNNINFTFGPVLTLSVSGDLDIPDLQPGTAADSNVITVSASTNNVTGYTITANAGNASYGSGTNYNANDLVLTNGATPASTAVAKFTSLATNSSYPAMDDSGVVDNTWGYSYQIDGAAWQNYSGLPAYTGNAVTLRATDAPSEDNIKFKIGAKAASTQTTGIYTNVVNFMAVTNAVPMTLSEAFAAAGAEQVSGYYKMQDMTSSICNAAEVYDKDSQTELIDTRDNKVYVVTKLRDGHCWMVQNLQTDINDPNITFTNQNTNITTNPGAAEGYSTSGSTITWTPSAGKAQVVNYAAGDPASSVTGWINSTTSPSYAVPADGGGHYMVKGTPYATTAACTSALSADECRPYNIGYYYNFSAAVASNDTSSYETDKTVMPNSICPAGWRLPNGLTTSGSTTNPSEYNLLLNAYGLAGGTDTTGNANVGWAGGGMNAFESAPFYFGRSGYVNDSALYSFTTYAYLWSSTVTSSSHSFDLSYNPSVLHPAHRVRRGNGRSLRCLAS